MSKFGLKKRVGIRHKSKRFGIPGVGDLICMCGSVEYNADLFNAQLRYEESAAKVPDSEIESHSDFTAARKPARDKAVATYPGTVIVGWDGITDASGKPVAFTEADCREFLRELADGDDDAVWVLDRLITWARNPSNFVDGEAIDAEKTAGN